MPIVKIEESSTFPKKMIEADIKKLSIIQFNNYFIYFQNKIVANSRRYKVQIKNFKYFYGGVSFFCIILIGGL